MLSEYNSPFLLKQQNDVRNNTAYYNIKHGMFDHGNHIAGEVNIRKNGM